MKKVILAVLSLGLLLSGCSTDLKKEDKVVEKSGDSKDKAILPKYSISDDYYKTAVPFKSGSAHGLAVQGLNSRLDVDEFETGLMRIAKESYDTKDYFYQEGKYLDKDTIQALLGRKRTPEQQANLEKVSKKKLPNGLNPELPAGESETLQAKNEKSPIYLAQILEQDYLKTKSNNEAELSGVVIGLAMNSVNYYTEEHGYPRENKISDEELLKQGKEMAQEILPILKQKDELKNVPITFAIYRQESKSSLVPGSYLSYTTVDKGSDKVEDWKAIDEKYYLFPSNEADTNYRDDATIVKNFNAKLATYFDGNYTAVVGRGFYKDGQLKEMKLEIPVQFNGKAEVIGFTQFVAGAVMEYFPNYVKVQVTIKSVERPEAIIIRDVKQDKPFVQILD
ncbi:CamS family sex pheromone protein [Bacillus sp. 3103sda1]|uniref:CamS family sex pheromone protein n=1 Tax=Bacillus sp. 3103sda1 TaxID=2953808 RepID=UPI00209FD7A1|nr:CamS family sex pheromone protein [Bacillus sp. 3103sda1]MCP1122099.1 CamS family sex pheromone protein [Bacillus sp. 3103sda1]